MIYERVCTPKPPRQPVPNSQLPWIPQTRGGLPNNPVRK